MVLTDGLNGTEPPIREMSSAVTLPRDTLVDPEIGVTHYVGAYNVDRGIRSELRVTADDNATAREKIERHGLDVLYIDRAA